MSKALHTPDFSFELPFKSSAIRKTGKVVREGSLLTNVEISFELEQCSGPGEQQVKIGRISDVAQRTDFVGSAKIFRARPAAVCMMTGINFVNGLALIRWASS